MKKGFMEYKEKRRMNDDEYYVKYLRPDLLEHQEEETFLEDSINKKEEKLKQSEKELSDKKEAGTN